MNVMESTLQSTTDTTIARFPISAVPAGGNQILINAEHDDCMKVVKADNYRVIKITRDEDLAAQIGRDVQFDLVDHEKVTSFRVSEQLPFNLFKETVAMEFGIPVHFQRFWFWAARQNHTCRPDRPLTHIEETQSVGELREANSAPEEELKLFLEVEIGWDLHPTALPDMTEEHKLLFFKLYDPEKEEVKYVGRLFVISSAMPVEYFPKLNEMAGYAPDEKIDLYEEIRFLPAIVCEPIAEKLSFQASVIGDGDIIWFQKSLPVKSDEQVHYPNVPSYLEYLHKLQVVHFKSLEKSEGKDFYLTMTKLTTYNEVVARVAEQLLLHDLTKISLMSDKQPKPQPIKCEGVDCLSNILVKHNQGSNILYYKVLRIPLPEPHGLKALKVAFNATKDDVVLQTIILPKQNTVQDVLTVMKTKVELSDKNAELLLLEVFYHKIYKILPLSDRIETIYNQNWTLQAEEVPADVKHLGPNDRLINVHHFRRDTSQNHMKIQNFGKPFLVLVHEGETLSGIKVQIQKKVSVPDQEFSKWKIACVLLDIPVYLKDSDVVLSHFQSRDVYHSGEQYLGLEHGEHL